MEYGPGKAVVVGFNFTVLALSAHLFCTLVAFPPSFLTTLFPFDFVSSKKAVGEIFSSARRISVRRDENSVLNWKWYCWNWSNTFSTFSFVGSISPAFGIVSSHESILPNFRTFESWSWFPLISINCSILVYILLFGYPMFTFFSSILTHTRPWIAAFWKKGSPFVKTQRNIIA